MQGIETPIFRFFPELAHLRTIAKDGILLKHLLNMTMSLGACAAIRSHRVHAHIVTPRFSGGR